MKNKQIKVCLVSSHGGHLHELSEAVQGLAYKTYWVTYKNENTQRSLHNQPHYFILDPCTSKIKYAINAVQSLYHLIKERPLVIISTGAGIAIPTILLGKFIFRSKIIYIESAACVVQPSRSGRFLYKYADLFLIQWTTMQRYYPNAKYTGIL